MRAKALPDSWFQMQHCGLTQQLSTNQIASEIGCARSTVAKYLKLFETPLRPEDLAHDLNKGQLGYGEKRLRGAILCHQREQENIGRMQDLRSKGFSYHKIADVLNSMGIPTKNVGSRWHATTVMNILNSNN